jgi:hypothetical protein
MFVGRSFGEGQRIWLLFSDGLFESEVQASSIGTEDGLADGITEVDVDGALLGAVEAT